MKNEEIGTYPICESIMINPKLKVQKRGGQIIAKINNAVHIGNYEIIKKCVPIDKLVFAKTLINNSIVQEKTAIEIYSDVFGIESNNDKSHVFDPEGVWDMSKKMATSKNEAVKVNKFKLFDNDDTRLI